MKILIVTQYFYPETFRVNTLAKELVKRGHQVTVLTGYPQYPQGEIYPGYGFSIPYEKTWNGVTIERVKMRPRGHNAIGLLMNCLSFVTEGNKWVRRCKERFDAVYVFEVSPVTVGFPALTYKKKFKTPVFFNVQDLWPENVEEILGIHNKLVIGVINKLVNKIYRESDTILCSSNGFVENIAARGVPRAKLVYWPQFCEEPTFDDVTAPPCYDDRYFNVVFAGNLGDAQGLDLLIEAANRLKNENIRWYLVGDGRAKKRLMQLADDNQLSNIVFFVGKVSEHEANRYVKFADCAYLSFKDCALFDLTIPAKLQTYLACGTPILGVVGGESKEIIQHACCGVVTERNAQAIADGVKKLVDSTPSEMNTYRKNAYRCYARSFSTGDIIDRLETMMSDVSFGGGKTCPIERVPVTVISTCKKDG